MDPNVDDSHDVVAHWMVMMNTVCGERLYKKGTGIFRENTTDKKEEPEIPFTEIPLNSRILLKHWKNRSGKYVCFSPDGLSNYIHITSPIRRLVDLLNLIVFQREIGLVEEVSREATGFLNKWQSNLQEINRRIQSARKVQIDCYLLHRCSAYPVYLQDSLRYTSEISSENLSVSKLIRNSGTGTQTPNRGIIFDRVEKPNGTYSYMVHLSDLNILGRVVSEEKYVNYSSLEFRLFVFQDEDKIRRKIRLAIQTPSNKVIRS